MNSFQYVQVMSYIEKLIARGILDKKVENKDKYTITYKLFYLLTKRRKYLYSKKVRLKSLIPI